MADEILLSEDLLRQLMSVGEADLLVAIPTYNNEATIGQTICVSGWTRTVRPPVEYTNGLKLRQMREYGLGGDPSDYQDDHLISLELGGSPTDPRNLWPEPYPRASKVDQIENQLNAEICSGKITLAEGQQRESALKHSQG